MKPIRFGAQLEMPLEYLDMTRVEEELTIENKSATIVRDLGFRGGKETPFVSLYWLDTERYVHLPRNYSDLPLTEEGMQAVMQSDYLQDILPTPAQASWKFRRTLRPKQVPVAQALLAGDELGERDKLLCLACGSGKALAHGEPVRVPNGWKLIEELCVGDLVAGTDGLFYPVTGMYPQGKRMLFRVTFTDDTSVLCDKDHLWTLQKRREPDQPWVTMTTFELYETQYPENRNADSLRGVAGRNYYLPVTKPVQPRIKALLPIDPYTLGVILGNGGITGKVLYITTPDTFVIEQLILPRNYRACETASLTCGKAISYRLSPDASNGQKRKGVLIKLLAALGLHGKNSHRKFIPAVYKYKATPEQRLALLQGLFDTDGYPHACALEYSTVSQRLCNDVTEVVTSLGGTAVTSYRKSNYVSPKHPGREYWYYRMYVKLPKELEPFRLPRKQEKISNDTRQRGTHRAVASVTLAGQGLATCISVDSPDHLFLTRNHVPTHNTVLSLWYAAQRGLQTLIIVDSDFLAAQWETQINKCLWVDKKKIGRIQGDVFNVQPITIAMLQTLGRRIDNLHKEFFDVWGLVIFDECHVASAPQASRVLPCFPGSRLGLSATPTRQDGLEPVFMWHLGGLTPFYVDLEKEKPARWCFKRIPRAVSEQDEATCWRRVPGRTNRQGNAVYSLMRSRFDSFAAKSEMWNDIILQDVIDAVDSKRQSIVLGTRVAQLTELCTEAQRLGIDAGLVVGDVKGQNRKDVLDSKQVIFATAKLASKALDVPRLDTLFILYPTTDANFLRQASGRISREHGDKQEPTVVVYSHGYNDRLLRREGEMKDAVSQIDPGATISMWGRDT